MAGLIPGVKCARRRRCHQGGGGGGGGGWSESPRRPSFCLCTTNHESHLSSSSALVKRWTVSKVHEDEELGGAAREAKERLDERLRAQWTSETKRGNGQDSLRHTDQGRTMTAARRDLQKEVLGLKKTGQRRLMSWAKLANWKGGSEQADESCAICLDQFKAGHDDDDEEEEEGLVNLPCTHRFHSRCLVPWLQTNQHCPCCRMGIFS